MIRKQRKTYQFFSSILLLLTFACNDSSEKTIPIQAENTITRVIDTIYAGERDTTIFLNAGKAILKGHINSHRHQLKYTLPVWKSQTVTAVLKPLKKGGNVCIVQVQKPGGDIDVPMGDSLRFTIEDNGNVSFMIGENLKAGIPFRGEIILHITVK